MGLCLPMGGPSHQGKRLYLGVEAPPFVTFILFPWGPSLRAGHPSTISGHAWAWPISLGLAPIECFCCCLVTKSRLTVLLPTRLLCPWNSPGKNIEVGSHSLLQEIFLNQGWKPSPLTKAIGFTLCPQEAG